MKLFLKTFLSFTIILIGYAVLMYFVNVRIIKTKKNSWKNCSILFAGDSHTQKALDPKKFHSALNISQEAEPYYITYWKLEKYLSLYGFDTLLLGYSYENLSSFNDKKLTDIFWCDELFKRLYTIKNLSAIQDVPIDKQEFYKIKLKNMCLYPNIKPLDYTGGYSNSNYTDLSGVDAAINRHYANAKTSQLSLNYLDSIVSLCNSKHIAVIMVNTPMHFSYLNKVPPQFIYAFQNEKNKLLQHNVQILDFGEEKYPDSFFLNPDHLNKRGAEKFSEEVRNKLNNTP